MMAALMAVHTPTCVYASCVSTARLACSWCRCTQDQHGKHPPLKRCRRGAVVHRRTRCCGAASRREIYTIHSATHRRCRASKWLSEGQRRSSTRKCRALLGPQCHTHVRVVHTLASGARDTTSTSFSCVRCRNSDRDHAITCAPLAEKCTCATGWCPTQ
jgi:hypothetical protein